MTRSIVALVVLALAGLPALAGVVRADALDDAAQCVQITANPTAAL